MASTVHSLVLFVLMEESVIHLSGYVIALQASQALFAIPQLRGYFRA